MRRINRLDRSAPAGSGRRPSRSAVGLALASVTVALLTAGCSTQDAACGGGEYPVLAVGEAGSACVPDGEAPPKGYARYPKGKVPEHVGDKWDKYWETHTVDENGKAIDIPAESGE
ncbi:SCO0607 family lipoprotein [Streptomyces atratus]|uniref:SCO0607 family lipoprotein n=1 Tax=Streptomyces atratus TaxID=1893 RepID=UPI00364E723F